MHIQCKLAILALALTLDDQAHAGGIVGGREAAPHSRPYMVLLERHMEDGEKKYCGGFLLNEDFVMSAAHCQAKSYMVSLGVHHVYQTHGRQRISVEQTFPRRDYNETDHINDIMLLKLSSKANFNRNVRPIALAGQGNGILPKACSISGWGKKDMNTDYMSLVLMEVNVTLFESELCAEENLYCSKGEAGPGEGDSGGPLVCEDGEAYGVVASIFKPDSDGPTIYSFAKIPDYGGWIHSTMENKRKLSHF